MTMAMGQDPTPGSLTCQWPLRGSDWHAGVVRLFEDGGEFRLLLVGGEDEQVIAGVQGGVRADRDQLLVADDEADPHVDRQVCEFFDGAAVGR